MKWLLSLVLMTSVAHAQFNGWHLQHSTKEIANSNPEIIQLVEKYRFLFGSNGTASISRVAVNSYYYVYFGESTCDQDDYRLTSIKYGYGYCYMDEYTGREECKYRKPKAPLAADPCYGDNQ